MSKRTIDYASPISSSKFTNSMRNFGQTSEPKQYIPRGTVLIPQDRSAAVFDKQMRKTQAGSLNFTSLKKSHKLFQVPTQSVLGGKKQSTKSTIKVKHPTNKKGKKTL